MNAKLEPKKDPQVLAIESKLKDRVSINMDKQPLTEAITFLQNYTGLNIVLDPKALGEEGLTSSSPVSLVGQSDSAQERAQAHAQAAGPDLQGRGRRRPDHQPAGRPVADVSQDVLRRRPGHAAGSRSAEPAAAHGDEPDPQQSRVETDANGIQTQGVFAAADPRFAQALQRQSESAKGERPMVDMMPLIQLITTSIAPGTWNIQDGYGHEVPPAYGMGGGFGGDQGGIDTQRQPGAIVPFFLSISLIIKHTAEVHEQVADLLRQLRRLQDLQVSVEVRFITVNDTFFEQIGVDFDFQIQSDTVGKHSDVRGRRTRSSSLFPISGPHHRHDHRHQHVDRRRPADGDRRRHDRRRYDRRRHNRRRRHDRRRRRRPAAAVRPPAARRRYGRRRRPAERPAAAARPAVVSQPVYLVNPDPRPCARQ